MEEERLYKILLKKPNDSGLGSELWDPENEIVLLGKTENSNRGSSPGKDGRGKLATGKCESTEGEQLT